ncbi:MAG: hypothetical protein A4E71_01079 [Smithella sp. PtaU1.Bin162]|nr:MAG: hypothetical protein A4E71_01079 [Smithella sp. PtaU1.Bin162]
MNKGRKGHGFFLVVQNGKLSDRFGIPAVITFRLNIDLPLPAEPVKIIYKGSSHKCLHGLIHLSYIHTMLQHLIAIHANQHLRNRRLKRGCHTGQFRPFSGRFDKPGRIGGKKSDIFTLPVLQNEGNASGMSDTGNCRRGKGKGQPLGKSGKLTVEIAENGLFLFFRFCPFAPVLKINIVKGHGRVGRCFKKAETGNGCIVLNARCAR